MAKCFVAFNRHTQTWVGMLALGGKVIMTTEAWSRAGALNQLTAKLSNRKVSL